MTAPRLAAKLPVAGGVAAASLDAYARAPATSPLKAMDTVRTVRTYIGRQVIYQMNSKCGRIYIGVAYEFSYFARTLQKWGEHLKYHALCFETLAKLCKRLSETDNGPQPLHRSIARPHRQDARRALVIRAR